MQHLIIKIIVWIQKIRFFLENQFYFNFLFCFMNIFLLEPTNTRFLLIEKKTVAIK